MLRKPLAEVYGGQPHFGLENFRSPDDPEYIAIRDWIALERNGGITHAPLDPLEECRRLRDARSDAYRSVSDHTIDSDATTTKVVHEILASAALVSGEQT